MIMGSQVQLSRLIINLMINKLITEPFLLGAAMLTVGTIEALNPNTCSIQI